MIFTSPTGEAQKRMPIDSGLSCSFFPPSVALICQTTTSSYISNKILPTYHFSIHLNHFSHPEEEAVHSCKTSEPVTTAQRRNPKKRYRLINNHTEYLKTYIRNVLHKLFVDIYHIIYYLRMKAKNTLQRML
jgi:hypothetical protein